MDSEGSPIHGSLPTKCFFGQQINGVSPRVDIIPNISRDNHKIASEKTDLLASSFTISAPRGKYEDILRLFFSPSSTQTENFEKANQSTH